MQNDDDFYGVQRKAAFVGHSVVEFTWDEMEKKYGFGKCLKLRPILFNSNMVNAILRGHKTMTRRKVKTRGEKCPYGNVGDVLWVRETTFTFGGRVSYKADHLHCKGKNPNVKFTSSIFMKKKDCRIYLIITDVRIERLKKISKKDAKKEGVEFRANTLFGDTEVVYRDYLGGSDYKTPIQSFKSLWQKINGYNSWDENPWVWVIEFKVAKCGL